MAPSTAMWRAFTPAAMSIVAVAKQAIIAVPRSGSTTTSRHARATTKRYGTSVRRLRVICGRSARSFAP